MAAIWTIAWREYRTRVVSPLFIGLTVFMFLALVLGPIIGVTVFGNRMSAPIVIKVIDGTGLLLPELQDALARAAAKAPEPEELPDLAPLVIEAAPEAAELVEQARNGQVAAVLELSGRNAADFQARLSSSSALTLGRVANRLQPVWAEVVRHQRLQGISVDPAVIQALTEPVKLETLQLTTGADSKAYATRTGMAMVFTMLMYMGILLYAALTFQAVLEEKTSRVMEVLVAAVRPEALLAGKVLGMGLVGLTQFATWFLAYVLLLILPVAIVSATVAKLDPIIFLYMLVYYVLGFFVNSSLYAAAASTISRMEDSQALMAPLTMLVVGGYLVSIFALQNPSGDFARWFSLVPWFAPTVMITRMALSQPAPWEVAASILLLILTLAGSVWIAARIYRTGVLMYGTRPTLGTLWRYLREG